jgi:hypothetical protein
MDLFSENFRFTSQMPYLMNELKVVNIDYLPLLQPLPYQELPSHLLESFQLAFEPIIASDGEIITPRYWLSFRNGSNIFVKGIINFDVIESNQIVQLRDHRYSALSIDEVMSAPPVDVYEFNFSINFLIPRTQFFYPNHAQYLPSDSNLHIIL